MDVNNGSRAGGGFHIAPEARADDGLLDLILIDALHPFERLRWLPVIEKGKHLNLSFIHYSKTKKVIIESDEPIQSHLDGEYYTAAKNGDRNFTREDFYFDIRRRAMGFKPWHVFLSP